MLSTWVQFLCLTVYRCTYDGSNKKYYVNQKFLYCCTVVAMAQWAGVGLMIARFKPPGFEPCLEEDIHFNLLRSTQPFIPPVSIN